MYHSYPLTDVEPVITNAELADWLGVDDTDPLLPVMATSATSAAIEFLQSELISRQRQTIYQEWPSVGTNTAPSISPNNISSKLYIDLPYARLISVDFLILGGTITTDYKEVISLPAKLYIDSPVVTSEAGNPAISVTYTAGYGLISDVPQAVKTAVSMLAAYMYDHRGACDVTSALNQSGAAMALTPYKTSVVVL